MHRLPALLGGAVLMVIAQQALVAPAQAAAEVQEVVTESGIRAYLVPEPSIPFLSLSLEFRGGSATDPDGKAGLAYMVSGLLDEGAGPYDSQAYRAELDDNAISLSFDADRDGLSGDLRTLTETRDHAFDLLRLALQEPRFDEEPVGRVRSQILGDLARRESDPQYVASRLWFEKAFPDHPYGRPTRGTKASVAGLTAVDLRRFVAERLARDNLVVGVSGDITADELKPLLERTFGGLPAHANGIDVPKVAPETAPRPVVERLDIPQSVVVFGKAGIPRDDPDYYAAYVANYILGGGGFSSRLLEEIREKRGLAYGAASYLYDLDDSPLWLGGVATRNDAVAQSVDLVRQEARRMAAGEVDATDLDNAKTYLTGSFPLRLTSNGQIAGMLVSVQLAHLGRDYLDRRNGLIEAVTLDDLKRVAKRLFSGDLLVTVVGQPQGVEG